MHFCNFLRGGGVLPSESILNNPRLGPMTPRSSISTLLGNSKNMKLTSINFRGENRTLIFLVALGFVLAHSATIALVGISNPILDPNSFRQTQTALSVYWIMHDGISLAYETPVLGYPWSIPMEFPIYQWIVALFGVVGIPIEIAGRLVSYSFFIACLWPIWMIFRFMKLKTEIFLITAILFLSSPLYLHFSRTVMIESLALFLAALWLALLMALLTMPKATWSNFIAVVVAGTLAGLTKITTLLPFYFLAGLFFLDRAYSSWRERQISDHWKTFAFAFVACAIPIVITYAWVVYADAIKAAGNPFGQDLTSTALMTWNFGTIRQRLTPTFWEDIVGHRVLNDLFGYGAIFAVLAAGTILTNSRYVMQMLGVGFAFLIPFLLFTNLHWVHRYYQYANGVFLIILVGLAITNLFEANRTRLGITVLALIVAGQIAYFYVHFASYRTADYSRNATLRLATLARSLTSENQSLLVIWPAWSSEVPFYSQRKSLVVSSVPQLLRAELMQRVFDNPQSFLGDYPLGGIAYCKDTLRDRVSEEKLGLIAAFLSGRKVLGRDGDCELLSASRFEMPSQGM
jgi:hypothetical protein